MCMILRLFFALSIVILAFPANAIWNVETLDGSSLGMYNSMAIDSQGYTCISSYDYAEGALMYLTQTESGWQIEQVPGIIGLGFSSLVLDSNDVPHIVCWKSYSVITHAWRTADGWQVESLSKSSVRPSFRIDSADHLHICYSWSDTVIHMLQTETGWQETEWTDGWMDSFALDSNDLPHILVAREDPDEYLHKMLIYMYQDTALEWHESLLDDDYRYDQDAELQIDIADNPHLIYMNSESSRYCHLFLQNGEWITELLDFGDRSTSGIQFVMDNSGQVHLARIYYYDCNGYCGPFYEMYYYKRHEDGAWTMTILDDTANVGLYCSIAVKDNGDPRVCYYDVYDNDLKFASFDDSWTIGRVFDSGDAGYVSSLYVDNDGYRHVCYPDYSYRQLRYLYENSTGRHIEIVDSPVHVSSVCISTGSDGNPQIIYSDSGVLKYAYKNMDGWQNEIIEVNRTYSVSIIVDTDGVPHISYAVLGDVRYAYRSESGWEISTVNSDGWNGGVSLAIDTDNSPHLCWREGSSSSYTPAGDVRYADLENGQWQVESIDNSVGKTISATSIALDIENQPHVVFSESGIVYTRRTPEGWYSEMFDGGLISSQSLQLSSDGRPSVAYTRYGLRYAQKIDNEWCFNYVTRSSGNNLSLVLNSEDRPYIVYYNEKLNFAEDRQPACEDLGVTLEMPSVAFSEGDLFSCRVTICNPGVETLPDTPLFVILDVLGNYYFAPEFNAFSHYMIDVTPGQQTQVVIDGFNWPAMDDPWTGLNWYAALTDPSVTEIVGEMDTWTFDCN